MTAMDATASMRQLAARVLLGLWLLAAGWPAAAVEVTDDRGRVQKWESPPTRIVSLLPSLTETLCELGRCGRLVGVDRYSDWPAAVRRLPQLGGGIDPNVEAVLALRPDAVLMAPSSRAVAQLEALGLKVVALEPRTHADVRRVMGVLARLTGLDEAEADRIWRRIDEGVSQVARSLPAHARGARVYFEASGGFYAAGPGSFIGETLARLGVRNIVPAELGPFPKINPEFVVRANPDVIIVSERNAQGLAQRPGWRGIRAVREDRVCLFPADQANVLVRPGPRMDEAAALMARCLREKAP